MQVVSVRIHSQYYLFTMTTSLDKSENDDQVNHQHSKHFHTVLRLRKLVHYNRRYSTKYVSFFALTYQKFTNELSTLELLDQSSRNFYTIYIVSQKTAPIRQVGINSSK